MGKNYSFSLRNEKKTKDMCFHQRGANAMNIMKDIKMQFRCEKIKNIGTMSRAVPWARPLKPLPRAAKILN